MSRWLQEKKRATATRRTTLARAGQSPDEFQEAQDQGQISSVENVIKSIPAAIIAQRAIDCGSYARALFHWELFIRESPQSNDQEKPDRSSMYQRLHNIYMQIDEPDGLDGISAHLNILEPEQQAFQHRRAGRWPAAQSWYEIELAKTPSNEKYQVDLLNCFRESGQFGTWSAYVMLYCRLTSRTEQVKRYASYYSNATQSTSLELSHQLKLQSFLVEASWSTGRLNDLGKILDSVEGGDSADFNVGVARVLLAMQQKDPALVATTVKDLRGAVAKTLNSASASSLHACHETLLRLHIVYEMGALGGVSRARPTDRDLQILITTMEKRLSVIGSYISDKQYLLGIRRAVMQVSE